MSLPHLLRSFQWPITYWLMSKIPAMSENLSWSGSSPSGLPLLPPPKPHHPSMFWHFYFPQTCYDFSCHKTSFHGSPLYFLLALLKLHLVLPDSIFLNIPPSRSIHFFYLISFHWVYHYLILNYIFNCLLSYFMKTFHKAALLYSGSLIVSFIIGSPQAKVCLAYNNCS